MPEARADEVEGPPIEDLPVPPRAARTLLLLAVFLCAACGLVYELALVALGSYLIGNSVAQASIVLGVMVFAMGIGSIAAKPLQRRAAASFAVVEALLAVIGGLSVMGLYAAFAWLNLYQPALVVTAFTIGALIGAEIPLLMTLLQRIRKQAAGSAVADLFAADYVGALLGGLLFPFVLLPVLGQLRGALAVGVVNAVAGAFLVLWLLRSELSRRARVLVTGMYLLAVMILAGGFLLATQFEVTARQALFDDPIVHSQTTPYQEIVLTENVTAKGNPDLRLYLNGDLQFSSVDEYRYHEALVHPAMNGKHEDVLVLGGGDALAAREVLKHDGVKSLTQVELDSSMFDLARDDERLAELNKRAFHDPRVELVTADAFTWLRTNTRQYDVIVVDMPDPDAVPTAKLYTVEFYTLLTRSLAPEGRIVVQSGSPTFAPKSYWSIEASLQEAGWESVPYHVDVPSFGDWGFHLAGRETPKLALPESVATRSLDEASLQAAAVFPPDRARIDVEPSTLDRPRILEYQQQEWKNY